MYPVARVVNNLQIMGRIRFVKDNIISAIPNSPQDGRYANPNASLCNFINPIQPSTEHVIYTRWWEYIKSEIN